MLALLMLAGATLSACTPAPDPTPTPTAAFASDEEAFAAAEEVYREYNDAVNLARAGDDGPDPQSFLSGLALQNDLDASRVLKQNRVHIEGEGEVSRFAGVTASLAAEPVSLEATVCLDVSETRVVNEEGTDVTPADREQVVALDVTFVSSTDGLTIAKSTQNVQIEC